MIGASVCFILFLDMITATAPQRGSAHNQIEHLFAICQWFMLQSCGYKQKS